MTAWLAAHLLISLAVRIASCANCQSSRPRLLRFRGWERRFSRPDFLELGGFTLATLSSDIATYLPTLGPRPFSPSLLSPNICPYAVWGKARMEVRSRRSTVAARSPPDAAQPLAARDLLSPPARRSTAPTRQSDLDTVHSPAGQHTTLPPKLFRCQFLKTSLVNQPSAPHELLTNTDFSEICIAASGSSPSTLCLEKKTLV
jgi:hypothetical protein